ncbi:hypothetical protein K1719_045010 [Acacia pycnantha]|nr:hypothetical protein K1719_045010 [Acacia pycnantha]
MKMMPNLKSHTLKVKSNPSLEQIPLVTSTEEDDQVEKLIQWAKDVARLDLSFYSDKGIWGAMISGYVKNNCFKEGLYLFCFMQMNDIAPDESIFVSILPACAHLGALDVGIWIHRCLNQTRMSMSIRLGTRLLDMYAKCGHLDLAKRLFESMSQRDTICYNAMISGMAMHGEGENALKLFLDMEKAKIKPDDLTFLVVFSACSHAGMAQHGLKFLDKMINVYNIDPKAEHYNCLVDLLSILVCLPTF